MPATQVASLPIWFQVMLGIIAILGFLGGATFALFVIWPSIRRSNRVSDWIEREGKPFLVELTKKTSFAGTPRSAAEFKSNDEGGRL